MSRLVIFSGAGISAESGIQTFRDRDGLWEGHRVEEVCDFWTWRQNATTVHQFYNQRRLQLRDVEPNAFHQAVARWQREFDTVVMTQNVDDLLERASCRDVIHLHGDIKSMHCTGCEHRWTVGTTAWRYGEDACPACRLKLSVKPAVVFFHEHAPEYARQDSVIRSLRWHDVVLVAGTSCQVVPFHMLLAHSPALKILNCLAVPDGLNAVMHETFQHLLLEPCTTAVADIHSLALRHFSSAEPPSTAVRVPDWSA